MQINICSAVRAGRILRDSRQNQMMINDSLIDAIKLRFLKIQAFMVKSEEASPNRKW